jgi:transposase
MAQEVQPMAESTLYVGIDLHQDSVAIAVLRDWAQECESVDMLPSDLVKLRRYFTKLRARGEVRACYEASGCGYVLQRALTSWGVSCEVIAPSLIPVRSGDRRKTDRRDAVKLARHYRAGDLVPIRVPDQAEERVRTLVRCRETLTREILRSRHYVLKLLQARGVRYQQGKHWTLTHWRWLREVRLEGEDQTTLATYLALLDFKIEQRRVLDVRIAEIAREPAYRGAVALLRCLRGIDTLSAMTLVTEIGDVRRFASPRQLMGYLGLTVSEYSSGESERRGGITKAGNSRCRRVLVEAAWHYRHPPAISTALRERQQGQAPDVLAHASRAQRRLHARFVRLGSRMAPSKVVVAVARELVGFVWALLRREPHLLLARSA